MVLYNSFQKKHKSSFLFKFKQEIFLTWCLHSFAGKYDNKDHQMMNFSKEILDCTFFLVIIVINCYMCTNIYFATKR